ncbi:MAG: bifunctional phosphoribosyl-AMP cyclohydrolase/phosphoribosyl-ATP diphosphatase HisIE [Oscillospiraceae bacterium]|nr:bifunctional phosphoribosyl-AMP cyclohydrolase/phosphoribosyl-ATP diphosphatase HisIE [Oscillospiraceae bacterium]
MFDINNLKFGSDGLIPAIVQDYSSKQVLMTAYMNRESLDITLAEGKTCFWSRSRQKLWRKGEESGNFQHIQSVRTDCDCDTILIEVNKDGPACHTGRESCFYETIYDRDGKDMAEFTVGGLYSKLKERKDSPVEGSYTSYLYNKGLDKILKKVGEESTEIIIAAKSGDRDETVYEIADMCYHVLVLMVEACITPDDVKKELASRNIVEVKVKQEKMT